LPSKHENSESTQNKPQTDSQTNHIPNINNNQVNNNVNLPNTNYVNFSDLYNVQDLPSKERFLFLFKIDYLANQFLCGCSLRLGIQIISLVFLVASISKFFKVLHYDNLMKTILTGLLFLIYFIAGYCLIYSTIYNNPKYAYIGLAIYTVIFYIILFDNLLYIFINLFGILNPFDAIELFKDIIIFTFALAFFLLFHLYFLWVCYSYWLHLKNGNFELIKGNFYRSYEEYDSLNRNR